MGAKLTNRTVETAKAGRHMDGTVRGLTLLVWPSGSRSWVLRYQLNGKRRDMGLGPYPEITLAKAREMALDARRLVKIDRLDPMAERRRQECADVQDRRRAARSRASDRAGATPSTPSSGAHTLRPTPIQSSATST